MTWVWSNLDIIWSDTLAHLATALPAIVVSFLLSIPIGWLVVKLRSPSTDGGAPRRLARGAGGGIVAVASLLYAIPSLPLFIALPAVIGTDLQDPVNIVVALTLYGLALMVRSTADALSSVDPATQAAAVAMGYSPVQRFFRVDLPLAGPVLLAGLRVVSVSTISLTTVGAVLGVQSLGSLFTDGIQRTIPEEIGSGIVLVLVLAFVLDGLLVLLGRLVLPWTRSMPRATRRRAARSTAPVAEVTS
ncbi:ABC transporter permease [Curtobacterium sp. MCBD17_034]|uniref:ABC transporter permease n=1 Tax=unclassified Curtobacterium TaxID=257496 RepID=UPI000DA9F451|nr:MULTISPECIES: ABC transporter permease subunit [unclassified Curtobacterium]PZF61020.1 ABC transporter permease [Curtobacterium sp. MCBD17_034]PZM40370.1 ABC transporter permease [Curtobacterium sp. MCBD17_031]